MRTWIFIYDLYICINTKISQEKFTYKIKINNHAYAKPTEQNV